MTETANIDQEIRRANDALEETFGRADAPGMAELYTDDGMLLPSGSDVVQGKAAIRDFWQSVFDMGIVGARLESIEVEAHGDAAMEVGRYVLSSADGTALDEGKYVVFWAREDDGWKLRRDIWNTSRAPRDA